MWVLLATLGLPAIAADMPEPAPVAVFAQQEPPSSLAVPPPRYADEMYIRRLQSARDVRSVGVGLSFGGAGAIFVGLFIALADALGDGDGTVGALIAVGGVGAALAGPGVTLAGGYMARRVVKDLGGRPNGGLDVVAWVSYGAVPFTGIAWFPAVGFSWAFANSMIAQADRLLYERNAQVDPANGGRVGRQFTIRALPSFDAQTRRAGLRVDVVY